MSFKKFLYKKKHYDYIVSLGYNREVAYKFLKYYNFEESSLLNWTYSYTIDDLICALKNFNCIGFDFLQKPNPLWECSNSHIRFHGKVAMQKYIDNTATNKELEADKKDFISRISYLKEKFLKIAQSEKSKLYIYKIKSKDINNTIHSKILDLLNSLKFLGAKNFKLLIVAEKENLKKFKNCAEEYLVDFVDFFPPDNDVTGRKYEKNGWDKIFDKFSVSKPKNYKKNKKYKYEIISNYEKKYDLIFSIGEACSCAEVLRESRLRFYSYPFDWLYGSTFFR